ncbi:hypothetical protein AVEN_44971-1 [Araneus ventricosus]|uniref:Uncharacterized protein n=1 Tax=Araneus ventricosus TaxID=182803 RepID=A0A4Y2R5P1_ARAVE|nr:hypothetical protein AVEN_162302-1 [Araneus ventricosus]GBN70649.1 hypothetical protein AVEN_44971-1 [Araneus ventricosus]
MLNRDQITKTTPHRAPPSPNFRTTPAGGYLAPTDLTSTRPAYTAVLWWNRVSRLEPSGPEADTVPPGHHGPLFLLKLFFICFCCSRSPVAVETITRCLFFR